MTGIFLVIGLGSAFFFVRFGDKQEEIMDVPTDNFGRFDNKQKNTVVVQSDHSEVGSVRSSFASVRTSSIRSSAALGLSFSVRSITGWMKGTAIEDQSRRFAVTYLDERLAVKTAPLQISVSRTVPYGPIPNPCDQRGDPAMLESITDFDVTMELITKEAAIVEVDSYAYDDETKLSAQRFLQTGTQDPELELVSIGTLRGLDISAHVEGCGLFKYLFPIGNTEVLSVSRRFTLPRYLLLSEQTRKEGILIMKDEEERLFEDMLKSFRLL